MDVENSIQLSAEQHEQVFEPLCRAYSDFAEFPLIAETLKRAIIDIDGIEINRMTTKKVAEIYYNRKAFYTPEMAAMFKTIKQIFKSAYVLVLHSRELTKQFANPALNPAAEVIWLSIDTFRAEYPEFSAVEEGELQLLFHFRNFVKVCTLYIDPRLAKHVYLAIAGRLEGSQCAYITGGGQRQEVTNRVIIYEREGGWTAEPRPDRAHSRIQNNTPANRSSRQNVPNVVSHSHSGDDRETEAAKKRRGGSKSKDAKEVKPKIEPVTLPPFPLHSVHYNTTNNSTSSSASRQPSGDSGPQEEQSFFCTLDWNSATEIVSTWELPKEDVFISALLKGECSDSDV